MFLYQKRFYLKEASLFIPILNNKNVLTNLLFSTFVFIQIKNLQFTLIAHSIKNNTLFFSLFFVAMLSFSQSNIKSIQLRSLESDSYSTILPLGKGFELSFDDINADQKAYSYRIEHMTFDWKPSAIFSNDYIEGFQENTILNYENSFNTLQNYTNYRVQIPNKNTRITKSGNYVLSVLDTDNKLVFTRRFTLYEDKSIVGVQILRSRNTLEKDQKQTVHFTINYNANEVKNPTQELKVVVLQNEIWSSAITNLTPQYFKRDQLVYKYYDRSNFWSGNEYLNFDNKQIRNSTVQIASVEKKHIYYSYLYPQEARKNKPYTYFPDINGQFVIRTIEGVSPYVEADYALVHFSLTSDTVLDKEVYVYGAFNNFKMTAENKMFYNTVSKKYEASILLKQGFYNYTFALKDTENKANTQEINGSFFQTENQYKVLVYQKAFGENYYKVIGVGTGVMNPQE